MKYTVYKTTNLINNKIYIGCHKTTNLDDGYIGSGKYLKRAIIKYGIENFSKEILHIFEDSIRMFDKEAELVNEEFIKRKDTYNIIIGGFDHINKNKMNLYGNNGKSGFGKENLIGGKTKEHLLKTGGYELWCKRMSDSNKGNKNWLGKKHSEESKKKIGEANSKLQSGKGNSNYGNCWIYHPDLKKSKPVPRVELKEWEEKGWIKGRK